ncbi:monovalent cation/H+ antiporter subunit F [Brachybacterium phenoliresistens]|uniref:Monovalent cation/H+ antiporter subunit F n=1 Tax=Brachybacterium phenoliresistens TaxID=396014 RepID=Z9JS84_9MICO|nr:monovalent cation/H+ antiporter subunit F [Brachybacterium phenoliresistens]
MDLTLTVLAALLVLAALPTVHRMIVGPTILDRTVATDMLVVLVVLGLALYSAATGTTWAVTSMLALTAFAFVATVAVARFVAREEPRGARARALHPAGRGGTMTAQHDAIHPEIAEIAETAEGREGSAPADPEEPGSPGDGRDTTLWDQDHADWSAARAHPAGIDAEDESPSADALADALDRDGAGGGSSGADGPDAASDEQQGGDRR